MSSFVIRSSNIAACPKHSMSARHYKPDGSCYCTDKPAHRRLAWLEEEIRYRDAQVGKLREERDDLRGRL